MRYLDLGNGWTLLITIAFLVWGLFALIMSPSTYDSSNQCPDKEQTICRDNINTEK